MTEVPSNVRVACLLCGRMMQEGEPGAETVTDCCDECMEHERERMGVSTPSELPVHVNARASEPVAFVWTGARKAAVPLVAADRLSDVQIAADLGINQSTLTRWKQNAAFQRAVAEERERQITAVRRREITFKDARLAHYQQMVDICWGVIDERAKDPNNSGPGHETGLIVQRERVTMVKGKTIRELEHKADVALLAEMRACLKQTAQEMGQWVEKKETRGDAEHPLEVNVSGGTQPVEVRIRRDQWSPEFLRALKAQRAALALSEGTADDAEAGQ